MSINQNDIIPFMTYIRKMYVGFLESNIPDYEAYGFDTRVIISDYYIKSKGSKWYSIRVGKPSTGTVLFWIDSENGDIWQAAPKKSSPYTDTRSEVDGKSIGNIYKSNSWIKEKPFLIAAFPSVYKQNPKLFEGKFISEAKGYSWEWKGGGLVIYNPKGKDIAFLQGEDAEDLEKELEKTKNQKQVDNILYNYESKESPVGGSILERMQELAGVTILEKKEDDDFDGDDFYDEEGDIFIPDESEPKAKKTKKKPTNEHSLLEAVKYPTQYDAEFVAELISTLDRLSGGPTSKDFKDKFHEIQAIRRDLWEMAFGDKSPWVMSKRKGHVDWDQSKARAIGVNENAITESTDPNINAIGDMIGSASFFTLREPLVKKFGKKAVSYSMSPVAHYMVTVGGKKIIITSEKHVEDRPDLVRNGIAVGYM